MDDAVLVGKPLVEQVLKRFCLILRSTDAENDEFVTAEAGTDLAVSAAVTDDMGKLLERYQLIPICPEQLGGLPTPRTPCERRDGRVYTRDGADVTDAFLRGATQAGRIAVLYGAKLALLKARSPSCGHGEIYDGSFTGRRIPGSGLAAHGLETLGVTIYNESDIERLLEPTEETKP